MSAPSPIKLLGISGSLRAQSYNSGALSVVGSVLPEGMTFDVASLAHRPFYNADIEQRGFPAAVESFRRKFAAADALIFAVPEYNFSVPGVLKNALEWLSRPPDSPTNGKPCAVFGASVSPLGTARGSVPLPSHLCVAEHDSGECTACRHHECKDKVRCPGPADRSGVRRSHSTTRRRTAESNHPSAQQSGSLVGPRRETSTPHRTNIRNPGWSPTTVMCPLQGEVSSNRNTLPGLSRRVSPSVVVMEKVPCRTMPN